MEVNTMKLSTAVTCGGISLVVLSLALSGCGSSAKTSTATSTSTTISTHASGPGSACPRSEILAKIKKIAKDAGAYVEPVHMKDGLVVIETATDPSAIAALQGLADEYKNAQTNFLASKTGERCDPVWDAAQSHDLDESIERTSKGFIVVYSSQDPKVVESLQKSTCCDYCICPAGTVTSCASCC
jgi:hypothetical protein